MIPEPCPAPVRARPTGLRPDCPRPPSSGADDDAPTRER